MKAIPPAPTPMRVKAIIEMMEDAGLYTHAQEVQRLSDQRDRCELTLNSITSLATGVLNLDKDTTTGRTPMDSVQDPTF